MGLWRPATIGGHSEKLVEAGFEIGVDCWPPEMLGEGSDGQGLRWARAPVGEKRVRNAKGKSRWDLFSHTVGKGVRKEYAVETRGSGLGGGRDGLTWKLDGHED